MQRLFFVFFFVFSLFWNETENIHCDLQNIGDHLCSEKNEVLSGIEKNLELLEQSKQCEASSGKIVLA